MIRLKPMLVVWSASALVVVLYYGVLRQHVFHMEDTHAEVHVAVAFLVVTMVGLVAAFIIRVVTAIMGRPAPAAALSFRVALLTGTLLMLMVVLSQVTAYTPQVAGVRPVSELRSVEVNGRTEWLSIRGQDRTKPVLLFLSGGPGGSHLATARHYFASLESDYVVVVWEQPGAAKSFGAIAPEDLTLDTYLADGEAITAHQRGEFDQDRIYLMGESWGSALGLMMARQHPEYYRAFVGTGQMVDFLETERIDYQMALDDARRIGDEQLADRLAAQGPPPYTSGVALKTYAYLSPLYGTMARTGQLNDAPFSTMDGFFGVEYGLLDKINFSLSCVTLNNGRRVELDSAYFPTIDDGADCYELTEEERHIIDDLRSYFLESKALQRHVDYLYERGSMYMCYNGNLLFHGCVPMNEDGSFRTITYKGEEYTGRAWMDFCEEKARAAWNEHTQEGLDFMYFLWCGLLAPTSGRSFTTFERSFISDESTWKEPSDPYFRLIKEEEICEKILAEFGLDPKHGHIINGHVPVKVKKGESPLRANGRAIIIDGGFATPYHSKTGISGYTLIYNSRGLRLLQHQTVANVREALRENRDIESVSQTVELQARSCLVRDTDRGAAIMDEIADLHALLRAYQTGHIKPQ